MLENEKPKPKKDSAAEASILEAFNGATLEEGDLVCEGCLFEMLQEASCGCPDLMGEAEYQGRKVTLNKPTRGDVKKFKVYVKDPTTGNIKKVNFGHGGTSAKAKGEKTMKIRKNNPKARKSFRARHNCSSPGSKTKARYWSCRKFKNKRRRIMTTLTKDDVWKVVQMGLGMLVIPLGGWVWNTNIIVAELQNDLGDAEEVIVSLEKKLQGSDDNAKNIIGIEKDIEYMKGSLGRIELMVTRRKN